MATGECPQVVTSAPRADRGRGKWAHPSFVVQRVQACKVSVELKLNEEGKQGAGGATGDAGASCQAAHGDTANSTTT